jgi:hypothetical protein
MVGGFGEPETPGMQSRRPRRQRSSPRPRRVLLVGLPPLRLDALRPALSAVAEVHSVPFPGDQFDRAVVEVDYDLVVVDVTYLHASRVRPLITQRFEGSGAALAYVAADGQIRVHEEGSSEPGLLEDTSVEGLVAIASGSRLTVVQDR